MSNKMVHNIHFEDYSGLQFERLAFAYILRIEKWKQINWYGQLGQDRGKDIWGELKGKKAFFVCYQCANHQKLVFKKAKDDLDKICQGPNKTPNKFVLIIGGNISADLRERITEYANIKGIKDVEIWSGVEFEERLRKDAPGLIQRFCEGIEFPETVHDLAIFQSEIKGFDDSAILKAFADCFDRPAFTTPFYQESNLPHFKKAITDTIEALETGMYRLRDGTIIKQIPSVSSITDNNIEKCIKDIIVDLQKLRAAYEKFIKKGDIKPCGCGQEDCSVHIFSQKACTEMDKLRQNILGKFKIIYPKFSVKMWN